jgi:ketosteroid isomerase-like protein
VALAVVASPGGLVPRPASKSSKNIRKRGQDAIRHRWFSSPSETFSRMVVQHRTRIAKIAANTPEQEPNEKIIRELYHLAEATSKDTPKFVSLFADGGNFYDVPAGKKYYGKDIRVTVDVYAAAFPDMHRELYDFYFYDDVVVVELSLNGTHNGALTIPAGTIPPTGKWMKTPCCDVFHLKEGKVVSFHCYVAVPILLEQLGVFMNLQAALQR